MTGARSGDRDEDSHVPQFDGTKFSLTDDERAVLDRARLAKAAAQHLSLSDITAEIQRLSDGDTTALVRQLKTRSRAPAPAIAQALRTHLARVSEEQSTVALHDGLHYGVVSTNYISALSENDLAALLAADRERLGFLVSQPIREALATPEEFGVSVAVRVAVWSSMACMGHGGSVAALAWLVADPPGTWTDRQREAAAEAWLAVRRRYPAIPEHPVPLEQLCSTILEMELSGSLEKLGLSPALGKQSEDVGGAEDIDDHTGLRGRLVGLAARIDAEQSAYAQAREADLPAIAAAMDHGLVLPVAELARLGDLRARMTALLAEVATVTEGPEPQTLADAARHVRDMAEVIEAESALGRIRRLAGLVAPDYAADEAAQVRELADTAGSATDPAVLAALAALADLVELGTSDLQRSAELSRIVQPAIPQANVLVMLAGGGHLRLKAVEAPDALTPETGTAVSAGMGTDEAPETVDDPGAFVPDRPVKETMPAPSDTEMITAEAVPPEADPGEVLADLEFVVPQPAPAPAVSTVAPTASRQDVAGSGKTSPGGRERTHDKDKGIDTSALYSTLARRRQFALAGWLANAAQAPQAVSAAHRLAAYAAAMRGSVGPNAAAFADEVRTLDAGALASLIGAQMLVYAASVRAGLLSPAVGAAALLRDLTPSISKVGSAVEELTEALLVTFYSGAHLTPRNSDAAAEASGIEANHAALAKAAKTFLSTAASRTIRYQAATELWKLWMEPDGYFGAPLAIVAAGSRSEDDLRFVQRRATELRSRGTVEKAITADGPKVLSGRSIKKPIEARARDKIIDRAGEIADLLADWIASVDEISQTAAGGGWTDAPIAQLRAQISTVRSAALTELEVLAHSGNDARNAAVRAGIALLEDALDLVSGKVAISAGAEIPADRVANAPLILAEGLPMQTVPSLRPRRDVTIADIASAAEALANDPTGWSSAFARRSEEGDHVGTQVLIELLRETDPGLARRLSALRERDVAGAVAALDDEVDALTGRVDSDRLFGRLTYDQWSDLSARARAFEAEARGSRWDFDVMRAALADVEATREEQSLAAVEAAWERMGGRDLTDDERRRVSECLERHDLTTADEYLETILANGKLPEELVETDHLRQFFPAFPALFSDIGRADTLLLDLKNAISAGQNPVEGKLAKVLAAAGIDLSAITRNITAANRIDHWLKLTSSRSLDGQAGSVKSIVEQLGYIASGTSIPAKATRSPGGRSAWMYLSGVRVTVGDALIPAFGTRMSPSADTLRLLAVWGTPTVLEIVEQLRSEPVEHSVIVLYFGTLSVAARNEFAAALRSGRKLPPTIVIDDPMFAYLAAQSAPRRDITMSVALPFASAEPFTPDVAGLVPEEMFYGRTEELDQVVDMMGSCIVYGGRQLGKSALLRAAARDFGKANREPGKEPSRHAIYQSIYKCGQAVPADAVWPTLWPRLAERTIVPLDLPAGDIGGAVARHITRWIDANPDRQLLLLLDESDSFLDADSKDGSFPNVTAFKELMETTGRAVKVIFAGLHQTARFERLSNHPLAHLGKPVCVGPLRPQHALDLLTRPLRALGYRFGDINVAARVLALANHQPALIQLFGAKLLSRLQEAPSAAGTPPRVVTAEDVDAVWADDALRTEFRRRFDWTLNLDPRYKIIAYSVAFHAYANGIESVLSPIELRSQCEQWWPRGFASKDVLTGEFRALLDECVALGVLSYNSDGNYRLRTPHVLALLGSRDEVDDVLDQADAQEPPESFDGSLLRPPFLGGHTRSPLTSAQISDLLGPGSRVRVIVGSPALTVERCTRVLSDRNEHAAYGNLSFSIKEATVGGLAAACQQAARSARDVALVLVDLSTATHATAIAAWEQAREQIAGYSSGTLSVILLTTPAQAAMWAQCDRDADQSSGLTELHRYDSVGLRLWLTETTLPFQDEASRAELLQATGGWPIMVNRVVEGLLRDDLVTTSDPLEPIRQWLASPANAATLVDACGVRADVVLAQAWSFLVRELGDDAADLDTFADWLSLAAEDVPVLSDDALAAAGYGSTREVVQILRMLGVLVTSPDDGQMRLEPVVATATRTAAVTG